MITRGLTQVSVSVIVVTMLVACFATSVFAAGDSNVTNCANSALPGFRGYLPDCRAYEMSTPPYKAGYFVNASMIAGSLAPDGSQFFGESLGDFAGESSKTLDFTRPYSFSRSEEGWTTAPLLSSTSALERPGEHIVATLFRHFDETSRRTLWDVFYASDTAGSEPVDTLYIEEPDGTFVEVGPVHPAPVHWGSSSLGVGPQTVAASSEEEKTPGKRGLEHIVFGNTANGLTPGEKWTGDTTQSGSKTLYEYTGVGNIEPKLVGIKNQKKILTNTEAELISNCGTDLGRFTGEKYNAMAADGNVVFFTALESQGASCTGPSVSEIYARVDGERTIAISEPSAEGCSACNTSSGLQTASYQGASEDGSEVFFTTEQELFPGKAGRNLYEYNFAGPAGNKLTLVSEGGGGEAKVQGVVRLSPDGSHMYFVAEGKLANNANPEGAEAAEGADNLYLYDVKDSSSSNHLSFVATLSSSDESDWEPEDDKRQAEVTPDGKFLVFVSSARLTTGDTSSRPQLFEYAADKLELSRISIGQHSSQFPNGFNQNGNTADEVDNVTMSVPFYGGADMAAGDSTLSVSNDGAYVFFQTPQGLTPDASNNAVVGKACLFESGGVCLIGEHPIYVQNVYEYHWTGSKISSGNSYLISSGKDTSPFQSGEAVALLGTTPSGHDVFFSTSDSLVPRDTDSQEDIYDARIFGGFPETDTSSSCSAVCENALPVSPSLLSASSSTTAPEGNAKSPVRLKSKKAVKKKSAIKHKRGKRKKRKSGSKTSHSKKTNRGGK
jgi:hypothetical protein